MLKDVILEFKCISKLYSGVQALKNVNLALRSGEVHALVGENGAGKSTLIKTCSGAINPSSGTIIVHGKEFTSLTPKESRENGIAVIYQETNLVCELSACENIFLGKEIRKGVLLDKKEMYNKTVELFRQLKIEIDPNILVKNLTVGYQQIVEIAKALSEDAQILIMDEPSAALTNAEIKSMMKIIRTLNQSGVGIIYITHRMDEIFEIADVVTVLRDGELIATMGKDEITREQLVCMMVGRDLKETYPEHEKVEKSEVLLKIDRLSGNGLKDISITVFKGEVLGLGGLIGAKRTELVQIIFGCARMTAGEILFQGRKINPKTQKEAISYGIAMIPEDRKRQGILLNMSVGENISLPILKKISKASVVNTKKEKEIVNNYCSSLNIKTPSTAQLIKNLSGGNQQKVVLAKWLAVEPELIIFDEPTRGIDVGAKQEIYLIINELVRRGKTIIVISSEMEELMGVSDRIVVLAEGRITGELQKNEFDQEKILRYASQI